MSPRTFYTRVLGMVDADGRPIVIPTLMTGLADPIKYTLFGWPVFISPFIPEDQSNGSGSAQSYILFTNPSYLHIGQGEGLEIQISLERFFDFNQTAVRGIRMEDFTFAPAQGIVLLTGVN